MSKKQSVKTSVSVLTIIFSLVFAFTLSAGNGNGHWKSGPSVDDIYSSIRNAEPQYQWEESDVYFEHKGMTIACTLTIPITGKLPSIVITLNGFTGNRHDNPVPGTDEPVYHWVSRRLAEQGVATLRIDFRGSGESDGDFSMTSFSSQISDTIAAIDYIEDNLKHQVNTKSIGLLGFSQGGLVAAVTAGRDRRVDSVVLWSPVATPPHSYEGLLLKEGIQTGLALEDGGVLNAGIYINGVCYFSVPLGKEFYEDLFRVDPLAEIQKYRKPLMVVVGEQDIIVWPQPAKGNLFMKYHAGFEKLVNLETAGHSFGANGPEEVDDAVFWGAAWFLKTMK